MQCSKYCVCVCVLMVCVASTSDQSESGRSSQQPLGGCLRREARLVHVHIFMSTFTFSLSKFIIRYIILLQYCFVGCTLILVQINIAQ